MSCRSHTNRTRQNKTEKIRRGKRKWKINDGNQNWFGNWFNAILLLCCCHLFSIQLPLAYRLFSYSLTLASGHPLVSLSRDYSLIFIVLSLFGNPSFDYHLAVATPWQFIICTINIQFECEISVYIRIGNVIHRFGKWRRPSTENIMKSLLFYSQHRNRNGNGCPANRMKLKLNWKSVFILIFFSWFYK